MNIICLTKVANIVIVLIRWVLRLIVWKNAMFMTFS